MQIKKEPEEFRFTSWKVYKDAKELYRYIHQVTRKLPREYERSFSDQLLRSGLSVVLNIAEGSGKHSDASLHQFLGIAMGSLYEVFAIFDVMHENKLVSAAEFGGAVSKIHDIGNQLGGFKNSLKRGSRSR